MPTKSGILFFLLFVNVVVVAADDYQGGTWVNDYYRKDGTHVRGYYRGGGSRINSHYKGGSVDFNYSPSRTLESMGDALLRGDFDNRVKKVELSFIDKKWMKDQFYAGVDKEGLNKWARSQIKKCLEVTLSNFSTYEPMKWSVVRVAKGKYMLWHVYQHGAADEDPVVFEQLFILNVNGMVTKIFMAQSDEVK